MNKSATPNLSPSRPSSLVLPQLVSKPSNVSPVASFSGRGFDMIRSLPPQSVTRSYSGVLQSGDTGDINMNYSRPPPSLRYNVPPPNYLQNYPPPEDPGVRARLNECLETILNKAQEPPKSKKIQHSNAKNAVLFEAISLMSFSSHINLKFVIYLD